VRKGALIMASFATAGRNWKCPACSSNVVLEPAEVSSGDFILLTPGAPKGPLSLIGQCVTCRVCREIVATVELSRVQIDPSGNPQKQNNGRYITNHCYSLVQLLPPATGVIYPSESVPESILRDYNEAHLIRDLSPRSAAMLARRCLQQIIRSFYDVSGEKTLHGEIMAISGKIDQPLFDALMAIKWIGNEAVHGDAEVVEVAGNDVDVVMGAIDWLIDATYMEKRRREQGLQRVMELKAEKSL
jgi:Domain of unknown function (DUF4145)